MKSGLSRFDVYLSGTFEHLVMFSSDPLPFTNGNGSTSTHKNPDKAERVDAFVSRVSQ